MDLQEKLDRLNQSAMDLVEVECMNKGVDFNDPLHRKLIMLGIRAGSVVTFEKLLSDLEGH